jgi:hypothetical protein
MTSLLHPIHLMLFQRARERIAEPHRWTQWAYARNCDGADCSSHAQEACSWCVRGAVCRTSTELLRDTSIRSWPVQSMEHPAISFDRYVETLRKTASIGNFPRAYAEWNNACEINDEGTHKMVMDLLDSIIRQIKLDLAKQI